MKNCFECGGPAQHRHHVVPRSMGGTNLIPLCEHCHGLVHGRDFRVSALTKAALAVKKSKGEKTGGALPYGYRLAADGRTLEADEAEQRIVAAVRTLRAAGMTYAAVGQELTRVGYLPRSGKAWHPMTISRIAETT